MPQLRHILPALVMFDADDKRTLACQFSIASDRFYKGGDGLENDFTLFIRDFENGEVASDVFTALKCKTPFMVYQI
jgi:hypothetical protein